MTSGEPTMQVLYDGRLCRVGYLDYWWTWRTQYIRGWAKGNRERKAAARKG